MIVWSWAVTSRKLFGRLCECQYLDHKASIAYHYYFSTQGCKFVASFGAAAFEDEAPLVAAAAAARALLSKKLAMERGS